MVYKGILMMLMNYWPIGKIGLGRQRPELVTLKAEEGEIPRARYSINIIENNLK